MPLLPDKPKLDIRGLEKLDLHNLETILRIAEEGGTDLSTQLKYLDSVSVDSNTMRFDLLSYDWEHDKAVVEIGGTECRFDVPPEGEKVRFYYRGNYYYLNFDEKRLDKD